MVGFYFVFIFIRPRKGKIIWGLDGIDKMLT